MLHVSPLGFLSFPTGGYVPAGAIWLDGVADYLTWTPSVAGNRKTHTISFWAKIINKNTSNGYIIDAGPALGNGEGIRYTGSSSTPLLLTGMNGGGSTYRVTSAIYRDTTAWQHVMYRKNSDTASPILEIYVNGIQITDFSSTTALLQNDVGNMMNTNPHRIGANTYNATPAQFYGGYISEFILLDGTAADVTDFGEYDANGNWIPKDPTGLTFGTNGFWLDFADSNDLGKDVSTSVTKVPASGSYIGDLTGGGGLAAAFNNIIDTGANGAGGWSVVASSFYLGMDHGSGVTKTITGFKIYQPSNGRINGLGTHPIQLYGSNSAPTSETDGTVLFSGTFDDTPVSGGYSVYNSGITTSTAYRYHWVRFYSLGTGTNSVAEFQMFEGGTDLPNSFFPISMSSANQSVDRLTDDADNNVGNYGHANPNDALGNTSVPTATIVEGGRALTGTGALVSSIATTEGKWYCEFYIVGSNSNYPIPGVTRANIDENGWYLPGVNIRSGDGYISQYPFMTPSIAYGSSYTGGDIIMLALDQENGAVWFGKNGTWFNGATTSEIEAGTTTNAASNSGDWSQLNDGTPLVVGLSVYSSGTGHMIVEPQAFTYTPPTGFNPICTANLPAPTVTDPSAYMQTVLYTGTGSSNPITLTDAGGNAVAPDFVWIKRRDGAAWHQIVDIVRGAANGLYTNSTSAEATYPSYFTSFDSSGFTLAANTGTDSIFTNVSGQTYAAWCLKAGGAVEADNNSQGSIISTVSVAAHGGFSVVTYTGTGSNATVGNGISFADMVIVKDRDSASYSWNVYHSSMAATEVIYLEADNAKGTSSTTWNSTAPGNGVFSIGTSPAVNTNTTNYIAYCFKKTPGLIGIGSYVGNGSTDGTNVIVDDGASGFRPAWLMIKRTDVANSWTILDSTRSTYNPTDLVLLANSSQAESGAGSAYMDFTANGFKNRATSLWQNASGGTYIYLAFAEFPFGGSGVAQAKAR